MNYLVTRFLLFIIFVMCSGLIIAQSNQLQNNLAVPTASNFTYPQSAFIDSHNGNIWVTDFDNNRVLRFDVSTLTAVDELQSLTSPSDFFLGQNYPNPFNPVTQIIFSTKITDDVSLEVYNLLGQKVAVLFDEIATANTIYSIQFNANSLASGIYLYSLRTSNGIDVKKMCLLK
ncbi:MAG: T9SS type A sorting domain-containing protein [Ignavibacteriales bacterium]|nr:T9SS type A sorting domain-containing protein [Ignavibacteriales bacterium]